MLEAEQRSRLHKAIERIDQIINDALLLQLDISGGRHCPSVPKCGVVDLRRRRRRIEQQRDNPVTRERLLDHLKTGMD